MRMRIFAAIALILALILPSCEPVKTTDSAYGFTDSTGTAVVLHERPERVAILFSSFADIWVSAGGRVDITVGETVERGFADETAILVDSGAGHTAIDLESLIAAKPDLVIGTADYDCQRDAVKLCRSSGIPAASLRVESFDDYLALLEIFTNLTGEHDRYEKYGLEPSEKLDSLLESRRADGPRFLLIRAGSSARSTKAKRTGDTFVADMLAELGGVNIADSSPIAGSLSLEAIAKEDPELIFVTTMGDESAAIDFMKSQLESPEWRELDAVKSGQVHFLPKELFHFKPNSRWLEAYEYLAELLEVSR